MAKINTFKLEGFDIDIIFNNGFLAYTFEFEGRPYGQKVKVKSRKVEDISAATFLLIENALETYKKLNENRRLSETTQGVGRELGDSAESK